MRKSSYFTWILSVFPFLVQASTYRYKIQYEQSLLSKENIVEIIEHNDDQKCLIIKEENSEIVFQGDCPEVVDRIIESLKSDLGDIIEIKKYSSAGEGPSGTQDRGGFIR